MRCVCPERRFGGADDRSRTCNPAITNHLRYQLPLHLHNAPQCASPLRSCPSFRAVIQGGDKHTKITPFVPGAGIEPATPVPDMNPVQCSITVQGHPIFPWCHQSERSFSHRTDVPGPCSLVPLIGFEPMSNGLKGRCSTTEPKAAYPTIPSSPLRTSSTVGYNRLICENRNALRPMLGGRALPLGMRTEHDGTLHLTFYHRKTALSLNDFCPDVYGIWFFPNSRIKSAMLHPCSRIAFRCPYSCSCSLVFLHRCTASGPVRWHSQHR